jgi:Icc-related predicted phosphoesterase
MRLVLISDTHEQHGLVKLPEGDLLIHAGDFTYQGYTHKLADYFNWFKDASANYQYGGICIAGNHDRYLDPNPWQSGIHYNTAIQLTKDVPNVTYLNDSGVEVGGLKVWGSPVQPEFYDWAFNRKRGEPILKHWKMIPTDTDVLITHGPPFGILDLATGSDFHCGCTDLALYVDFYVRPKIHIFGHIHGGYGVEEKNGVIYVNASVVNEDYKVKNEPVVIDI